VTGPTEPVWQVILSPRAETQLARLPRSERDDVLRGLDRLQSGPRFHMGAKKLKGRNDWSLRVRERRIVFLADSIRRVIYVTRIGNRGDVYKGG